MRGTLLDDLAIPIVQAPMAGGPSTPELAIAVSEAGALGFLAAGYLEAERLQRDISVTRARVARFGVGMFAPGGEAADPEAIRAYAERLRGEAEEVEVELGTPRFDDDGFGQKLELLCEQPVPIVSLTFGIPPTAAIDRLHEAGSEVWLTVTSPAEAELAAAAGADALIVQGIEAGGHRGVFRDDESASELTLLAALQLIAAEVSLPLIAAGSIMTGAALAAVLVAGARAAQLGTAYLRADEAGTSTVQREATATASPTVLTRAFSGRTARGIENRFHRDHASAAPHGYPEVHHLTSPLRAKARNEGNAEVINLWAGEAHELARPLPAGLITRELATQAKAAVAATPWLQ